MKLFFAGAERYLRVLADVGASNLLISMYWGQNEVKKAHKIFNGRENILLDSGAFTAHNKGIFIDVDEWIQRAQDLQSFVSEIVSLDVIGNAKITLQNFKYISTYIPNLVPTFHLGSDLSYFKRYLDMTPRVAIGGMVLFKNRRKLLHQYLNEIFRLLNRNQLPHLHAFGIFSPITLQSFPFWSADATSWLGGGRFGKLINIATRDLCRIDLCKESLRRTATIDELYALTNSQYERNAYNARQFITFENYLTELWQRRSVKFQ